MASIHYIDDDDATRCRDGFVYTGRPTEFASAGRGALLTVPSLYAEHYFSFLLFFLLARSLQYEKLG